MKKHPGYTRDAEDRPPREQLLKEYVKELPEDHIARIGYNGLIDELVNQRAKQKRAERMLVASRLYPTLLLMNEQRHHDDRMSWEYWIEESITQADALIAHIDADDPLYVKKNGELVQRTARFVSLSEHCDVLAKAMSELDRDECNRCAAAAEILEAALCDGEDDKP